MYTIIQEPKKGYYDVIIIAVDHKLFIDIGIDKIKDFGNEDLITFDVKSVFPPDKPRLDCSYHFVNNTCKRL